MELSNKNTILTADAFYGRDPEFMRVNVNPVRFEDIMVACHLRRQAVE